MPHACKTFLLALAAHGASTSMAARTHVKLEASTAVARALDLIGTRRKDSGFLAEIKAIANQHITPGATESLNEALTTVIAEIQRDVEPKIKAGHASTQAEIDKRINALNAATAQAVQGKETADAADRTWFECVQEEKAMREAIEDAESTLAQARSDTNEPCQQQEDRAPFEWAPDAAKLKFVCDISEHGNCDLQMKNYQSQIDNMMAGLRIEVDAKVASYTEAKEACDAAKADVVKKQYALDGATASWQNQKRQCMQKHETRQVSMCLFGSNLQNKCDKGAAYLELMAAIDKENGGEYSHPDRVGEWTTIHMTTCMLSKVVEGGEINTASLDECEKSANFDQDVGVLDRKESTFKALTSSEKFTCSEKQITFTGKTWNVPEGDSPASSEYTIEEYHPEVRLAADAAAFGFCATAASGSLAEEKPKNTEQKRAINSVKDMFG